MPVLHGRRYSTLDTWGLIYYTTRSPSEMRYPLSILSIILLALIHLTSGYQKHPPSSAKDTIPFSTRAFWMCRANAAVGELDSPCLFAAFGTVIVNHTDLSEGPHGKAVCYGVNANGKTGNPTLHGEMSGINNCSRILVDPEGEYRLSPADSLRAFSALSLYTNAEPCPMCASAIRWAGFSECIYGTSIATLTEQGWGQMQITAGEVFRRSGDLPGTTTLIKELLTNETDPYFRWQFNETYPCPSGCERTASGSRCVVVGGKRATWEL